MKAAMKRMVTIVISLCSASASPPIQAAADEQRERSRAHEFRSLRQFAPSNRRGTAYRFGEDLYAPSTDPDKDYSVRVVADRFFDVRFEVRAGDHFPGDRSHPVERAELATGMRVPVGKEWGIYTELLVPPGQKPNNPRAFNTLMQLHAGPQMSGSPPFSMTLDYDDKTLAPFLKFLVVQRTAPQGEARMREVVRVPISYDHRYHILVRGRCAEQLNQGALRIEIDRRAIFASHAVPMGYSKAKPEGDYAKFGIYRGPNGGPKLTQPLVVYHRNFKFGPWAEFPAYLARVPWNATQPAT